MVDELYDQKIKYFNGLLKEMEDKLSILQKEVQKYVERKEEIIAVLDKLIKGE